MMFALLGLALIALGAVRATASGPGDPDDPFDLTAAGRACMERHGFDAGDLRFSAGRDGRVGFNSTVTSDLRDLDPIVPRLDGGRGGARAALDRCMTELRPLAESIAPKPIPVDPAVVAGVEACLADGPYGDLIDDVKVERWDDGVSSVGYSHVDLDEATIADIDEEIRRCFPTDLDG